MNQLTKPVSKEISKGAELLKSNPFFSDLCSLMKNVEFSKFYDTYFNDWSDIECMVFYMKLYNTIDFEYEKRFNEKISDEAITFMLHKVMTNKDTRIFAFDLFRNYKDQYGHKSTEGFCKLLEF